MSAIAFPRPAYAVDPAARAVEGAGGAPLTRQQKTRLILAARAAYDAQVLAGLWSEAEGFEAFRRAAAFEACGVASLRAMGQRHYNAVRARLLALAGREREAGYAERRACGDDARRALARLERECALAGEVFEDGRAGARRYAEALARRIHGEPAAALSARQVWQVIFTLRNRARAMARKTHVNGVFRPRTETRPRGAAIGGRLNRGLSRRVSVDSGVEP